MKRLILLLAILISPTLLLLHLPPGGGAKPPPLTVYVVQSGDTLWDIARRLYPGERTDKVVWEIRRTNGLEGADGPVLRVGQVLRIPWEGRR